MNDEQLIAVLAALLSVGRKEPPENFLQEAIALAVAAGRAVEENKRTQRLRIDYQIDCGTV